MLWNHFSFKNVYYIEKLNPTDLCLLHVLIIVRNLISTLKVREDVVAAYRKDMEWQTSGLFRPYKKMFTHKKV